MNRLMDTVNRVLGRSVVDLAGAVDDALGRLAQARGLEATARQALLLAEDDVREAQQAVASARDALFEQHPDLRPQTWSPVQDFHPTAGGTMSATPAPLSGDLEGALDPSKFEAVEVDDSDDPRYTAGATVVSPSDDDDLPPIVWEEHDE